MISIYQLKPRFQNLLRPLVQRLYDNGTTANQITVLAGVISLLVGLLIAGFAQHLWLFALIPLWMILRMALPRICTTGWNNSRRIRAGKQHSGVLAIAADMPELQSEVQVQLMRIIQEALNNVRKHARACQVELDAHRWNEDWIIQIQDDGLGFCQDEVPEYSRYGLRGMRERSEAIGADFQVVSKPGKGTTVMIRLPVPHQEVED